jgi:hypothetical protein
VLSLWCVKRQGLPSVVAVHSAYYRYIPGNNRRGNATCSPPMYRCQPLF